MVSHLKALLKPKTLKLNKNYPQFTKDFMDFASVINGKFAKTLEICFAK